MSAPPSFSRDCATSPSLEMRFGWNEWLGAVGDAGIMVPIYLSLVAFNGLDPVRPLLMVGLAYIFVSLFFRVPMPVQPLKAMAAIVIAQGFGIPFLEAGSVWLGVILLLLVATKKVDRLSRFFTLPIVKGIQFGVGLMLCRSAIKLVLPHDPAASTLLLQHRASTWPFYVAALWVLVLPQIPLTLGNAVFALCDAAHGYFGSRASRVSAQNVAASIGILDIFMGILGGLPVCHGSGGLTAHYRFGARTAGATILTGLFYILLALLFGAHAHQILKTIPAWVFGLMLGYVGICHAWLIKGLKSRSGFAVALIMGILGGLTDNLAYALLFGLACDRLVELFHSAPFFRIRSGDE